jgi:hypothetical protein
VSYCLRHPSNDISEWKPMYRSLGDVSVLLIKSSVVVLMKSRVNRVFRIQANYIQVTHYAAYDTFELI